MKVTITKQNINQYKSSTFPEIEEIRWRLNYLDSKVLGNFPNLRKLDCSDNKLVTLQEIANLTKLQTLYCSNNRLTNLQGLTNLTQLQKLYCSGNKLTTLQGLTSLTQLQTLYCFRNQLTNLQELTNLTQLQELYCSHNQLTTLQGITNFTQLQKLDCSYNQLTSLQGIDNLTQLRILYCYHNKLTNLQELAKLMQLQELYCSRNQITNPQGLANLTQLQLLNCSNNKLTTLQWLSNLAQLRILYCSNNQLTDLLPIVYLTQLQSLDYHNNPLNPPTIQEERFINRLTTRTHQTIYNDRQNVHNTTIQKSITQSTSNLLKDPKPDKPDITQLSAQSQALLQSYLNDQTPHSILLITYEELFSYVWARIQKSPHKDTLTQILEQELKDSTDLCYTGRFNRTINTLNGFYDDIEVHISDPDRINAIIHQYKDKDSIIQALQEAGYDKQTIKNWTTDL